jgi:beta-lactamase class A
VKDLAEASIVWSDNTCANLLLATIGGPKGVTELARALGDQVTRLDRTEPTLNMIAPGDPRDTTSPSAMLEDMNRILLGDALSEASRMQLTEWMIASRPGPNRIGAGLPSGWKRGHKTGTGMGGTTNDIAIAWPPGRKPILLTVYYTGAKARDADLEAAIADVARIVSASFV